MSAKRSTLLAAALACLCARAQAYDSIRFLAPIPAPQTDRPVAVAASTTRYYLLDEDQGRLCIYGADGSFEKTVDNAGPNFGRFRHPRGLALGPDGRIYVADTGNSRVAILSAEGLPLGGFGEKGSQPGQLRKPGSVAVGSDGRVYVADTGNDRVQVFTDQGILLFSFGSRGKALGQLREPTKVVVDASDRVFVLDSGNERVEEYDASARPVRELPFQGDDLSVDRYGFLYLLDSRQGRVFELSPQGVEQGRFGSEGSGPARWRRPEGLAIGEDGEILVADTGNRRIQRVELVNKDKTVALAPNPATKLLVSGPAVSLDWPARALAAADGRLCGWLAKARVFRCVGPGGKGERSFGHGGEGLSQTRQAGGLAFSGKLGFVASDTPADRLQVFSAAGAWQTNIAEASGFFDSKKKEGRVRQPLGVAINDEGTIYVADAGNHRVDAFDFNGNFLFAIGPKLGPLELQRPVAVAWDKARFLYIADQGLQKIVKTEPSGGYLASWGQSGKGAGQLLKPSALAFDGRSYLYLLDAGNKRVSIFDTDGHWQTDLFGRGRRDQALEEPSALAVQGDTLYVSDLASGKTKGFSLHVRLAAPDGLALAAKDGAVRLSWKPVDNPWLEGYEVLRSSEAAGPFMELARPAAAHFEDAQAAAQATYWYRVAALSASGDLGVASAASQIVVPASVNKSPVELSTVTIGDIFSADYKWYLGNAVGSAVVVNNVHAPFENVKLTFRLKDFMDFGYDTVIKTLAPEAAVRVPLMATLNNKILEVSEDTPIQAQLTLTYFENGQERQVSLAKPLRVYSRNAIRWDDPRRVAAFITPMDPPIVEFARAAESVAASSAPLNANVLTALRLWDSLSDYGVGFFANPDNPYEKLSEDPNFPVDYTQFPRETLKRKSGQCDDLTTLLISLLGASDVRAVVADYPGHMALMFDTGADEVEDVGLPPDQLVLYKGRYWAPLEPTLIGQPFRQAVSRAAQAYKDEASRGDAHIVDPEEAWKTFEPATLPPAQWSAEAPKALPRLAADASELARLRYETLKSLYQARLAKNPGDADSLVELGLLEHERGSDDAAAGFFSKALALAPRNAAALTDLGDVAFLRGQFEQARRRYRAAAESDGGDPDLWMNLARAQLRLGDEAGAKDSGAKASALDARLAPAVESLLGQTP